MKFLFILAASLIINVISPSQSLALEVPSEWKFKKIKTPHFDIIYNAEQQDLGELYAKQMERAFTLLSSLFTVHPERTLVIINDKTDATNGYATRIPYPHIMTYPVLPGPLESLSESADWSLELLAHEYAHILTFEPATGAFQVLRGVMGSIASPNILLPGWWKEGLAVQVESMLEPKGGRLKSLYQDAVIRAMTEDGSIFSYDIAQINEAIPTWPEGMRPYMFGSIFWSQAVEDYGKQVMNQLNLRHSSRVPYMIEEPALDILQTNYEGFYLRAVETTNNLALEQLKTLRQVPTTTIKPLPLKAKYSSAPAISQDGKYMALVTVDYKADRVMEIFSRDPETGMITKKHEVEIKKQVEPSLSSKGEDGPPSGVIQRIAWFNKSPKLIYDQLRYVNRIERYSDLHIYDLETGKSNRLTTALRAREPSVSPQDDKVVFVKLSGGRTSLGLYELASNKAEILFSPALQERISSPIFLDEETLLFALRNSQGEEGLWTFSLKDKTTKQVLTQFEQARLPSLTKHGLMFTSSNNGVHNLYLADADLQNAKAITHVTTLVSTAALDPESDNLYVTYMSSGGPKVVLIQPEEWKKTPATLPKVDRLFSSRYKEALLNVPELQTTPTEKFEESEYSPWGYMWPRYWIPFIWTSPEGGLIFQAQTSGFDPLQRHSYSILAGWNTYLQTLDGTVNYFNNTTSVPFQVTGGQTHSYLVSRENLVTDGLAQVSALPDVWNISDKLSAGLGWRYLERTLGTFSSSRRTGPFGTLIYKNIAQGGDQISPQEGGGAYLMAANYLPGDSLMSHSQFQTGGVFYYSGGLPSLHALVVRGSILYTPEKISPIYGTQSISADFTGQDLESKFLARGYSSGQFIGRNMYNLSLEYRMPIKAVYRGQGTNPFFVRRLNAAFITDALATDGWAFDVTPEIPKREDVTASEVFHSFGVEGRLETTIGYVFPLNFVLGLYKGTNEKYAPEPIWGLAIQFSGF